MLYLIYGGAFLLAGLILILVHEVGHLLVARCCRVKVLRFSIGFGKPLKRWQSAKSGIEYQVAPVLLGGYVKLLDTREGEVAPAERPFAYDQKPIWQRILILLAGPCANFKFALLVFWLMFMWGFKAPKPIIAQILPQSIASYAKVPAGVEIIKVGERRTTNWGEVMLAFLAEVGSNNPSLTITTYLPAKLQAHRYNLDLHQWHYATYKSDPLLSLGLVRYRPLRTAIVAKVVQGSPAARSGVEIGDKIIAVDQHQVVDGDACISLLESLPQRKLTLLLMRRGNVIKLPLTTGWKIGTGGKRVGYLGVKLVPQPWPATKLREYKYSVNRAVQAAWRQLWLYIDFNALMLTKLIRGKLSLDILGGPIAIFAASGQAWQGGWLIFLDFLAVLSLSIAIFNLIPLPGLDGGNIILLLVEASIRRPLAMRVQMLLLRLSIALLLILLVRVTVSDLSRIFLP